VTDRILEHVPVLQIADLLVPFVRQLAAQGPAKVGSREEGLRRSQHQARLKRERAVGGDGRPAASVACRFLLPNLRLEWTLRLLPPSLAVPPPPRTRKYKKENPGTDTRRFENELETYNEHIQTLDQLANDMSVA
jgi:hypothetical protein